MKQVLLKMGLSVFKGAWIIMIHLKYVDGFFDDGAFSRMKSYRNIQVHLFLRKDTQRFKVIRRA